MFTNHLFGGLTETEITELIKDELAEMELQNV